MAIRVTCNHCGAVLPVPKGLLDGKPPGRTPIHCSACGREILVEVGSTEGAGEEDLDERATVEIKQKPAEVPFDERATVELKRASTDEPEGPATPLEERATLELKRVPEARESAVPFDERATLEMKREARNDRATPRTSGGRPVSPELPQRTEVAGSEPEHPAKSRAAAATSDGQPPADPGDWSDEAPTLSRSAKTTPALPADAASGPPKTPLPADSTRRRRGTAKRSQHGRSKARDATAAPAAKSLPTRSSGHRSPSSAAGGDSRRPGSGALYWGLAAMGALAALIWFSAPSRDSRPAAKDRIQSASRSRARALPSRVAPNLSAAPAPAAQAPGALQAEACASCSASPSSSAPPGPPASARAVDSGPGSFDNDAVKAALDEAARQAGRCRMRGDPKGTIPVSITFEPSGAVKAARVLVQPYVDTPTARCVEARMQTVKAPPFSGPEVTLTHPVAVR